ncbi:MAG: DUF1761 domain-containing protein [Planctomycetes bacterium]|nr:DUF1761 domain-containing protein [Planctomycetota bacterium]
MSIPWTGVNWWAVLGAVVVHMFIGGMWYGPLFGEAWIRAVGFRKEDIKPQKVNEAMSIMVACTLLKCYALALLVRMLGADGILAGMEAGALLALGLVLPGVATNQAFEQRNRAFFVITGANHLVTLVAVGAVLGAWR